MFERETRREKILEARNKELRLKEKTKGILNLGGGGGLMNIGTGGGGGEGSGGSGAPVSPNWGSNRGRTANTDRRPTGSSRLSWWANLKK